MSDVRWSPYDVAALRRAGLGSDEVELLSERGLPEDVHRMFVRNADRELELAESPATGPLVFLGDFEDGVNSYYLSKTDGSVWMKKGYADEQSSFIRVNTSLNSLQRILYIWELFVCSGVHEEDDLYDSLVERTVAAAEDADPEVFEDEEGWWPRVFEEVELGVLAPE
ncbi:SUKH-4 family immunity protein [Streptomyces sp. ISL-12]|uniref:SUKH-4 family immunity protein n=1 Tax=Streptomyces sp. ISL-12 TaxID=2819177 RepID=UPI0027E0B5F6|nr:SUKH-4 family immunity protein [Streptomyces sp. ISL-12]